MKYNSAKNKPIKNDIHEGTNKKKVKRKAKKALDSETSEIIANKKIKQELTEDFIKENNENGVHHTNDEYENDKNDVGNTNEEKDIENDNDKDNVGDDNEAQTQFTQNEVDQLTGKILRQHFNAENGIDMLRKFLPVCEQSNDRDFIGEYLDAGGSVLEILRLLDMTEKKSLNNAATVFSTIHLIILRILSKYPQHLPSVDQACRHILNAHAPLIYGMMSNKSHTKQRKAVLKLLTTMVALGGNLPRELLNHLTFHPQVVEFLAQQTKPTDPGSVRKCFINFILAFLVDGNALIIKTLLERSGLLSSIFSGLIYDYHTTVHLVLSTVKTFVLENSSIMKTIKLRVFSTPVVQNLISLYNWRGPRNWPGINKKFISLAEDVDPAEKEVAVQAVHTFLTTLLTSNRHGIIFIDKTLGTSDRKHNQLVNTVLQSLDRPWEHEKPCELVLSILSSCPDLVKPQLIYTEPFLQPRLSSKWISSVKFVYKIIESMDIENYLKQFIVELNLSQLIHATQILTMPIIVLKTAVQPSINAESIVIRHQALLVLIIMLKQMRKFLTIVRDNFIESDFDNYKSAIFSYIKKHMPSVEDLLRVWNQAFVEESSEQPLNDVDAVHVPNKIDHLASIVELLDLYQAINSDMFTINCLEPSNNQFDMNLLNNLGTIQSSDVDVNELKIKLIGINYHLNPSVFGVKQNLFADGIKFLISLLGNQTVLAENNGTSSDDLADQAKKTLKVLLKSLQIFDEHDEQVDIWINCFMYLNDEQRTKVIRWFVNVIKNTSNDKYEDLCKTVEDKKDTEANAEKKNFLRDKKVMSCVPKALIVFLSHLRNRPNELGSIYMSYVLVLTLHYQAKPKILVDLTEGMGGLPDKYLNSWSKGTSASLKKYFPHNIISNYSKVLLSKETMKLDKLFSGDVNIEFEHKNQKVSFKHQLSVFEASNIFQMTLFYLSQLLRCKQLHQELLDRITLTVVAFLHIGKSLDQKYEHSNVVRKFSNMIFDNPIIFKHFSVASNNPNSCEIFTDSLIDFCRAIVDVTNDKKVTDEIFVSFKNKLMLEFSKLLNKNAEKGALSKSAVEFLDFFSLTNDEILNLLKRMIKRPENIFINDKHYLSGWGMILPKFIDLLLMNLPESIDDESETLKKIFAKVISILIELKAKQKIKLIESWELSLIKFFQEFSEATPIIEEKKFKQLLETNLSTSVVELIGFLIRRHGKLVSVVVECYTEHQSLQDKNIIFAIISSNLKFKWPEDFLDNVFNRYSNEIIRYLTFSNDEQENNDWIANNVEVISMFIEKCFTFEICDKISHKILSSGDKLESVDVNYIKLLRALYEKQEKHQDLIENTKEFIQILIRVVVNTLKKNSKADTKIYLLCNYLIESIEKLIENRSDNFSFEEVKRNNSWPQFIRLSLKLILKKNPKNHETKHSNETSSTSKDNEFPLLDIIARIIDLSYQDKSNDDFINTIFEMTTSHSEFVNLMLSFGHHPKKSLLHLLWVLIKKNSLVMSSTQIPLLLSAYNATLSESDQLILMILRYYENSEIKLNDFKPYLWGTAAINHYSVKENIDTSLLRQPLPSQVLELLNEDVINNTIMNFPINRSLNFADVELLQHHDVYDPAFFLPLFVHLLDGNNVIYCHKIVRSGALALILASVGSKCEDIRLAAFTVLSRFYFHLEAMRNKNNLLWMRFIDALHNGVVNSLDGNQQMEISSLKQVQINRFVTTFLAKASVISANPMSTLFMPIQLFLMAKPALDIRGIPEFLTMFHSGDINHKICRHWILEVLKDGMKTDEEVNLALRFSVFRMLFDFYHCVLADSETKNLILQVLHSTTRIVKGTLILIRDYSLLIWLNEVATKIQKNDNEKINVILNIINNLLDIFRTTKIRDQDLEHYKFVISVILSNLNIQTSKKNIDVMNNNCIEYKYLSCLNLIR